MICRWLHCRQPGWIETPPPCTETEDPSTQDFRLLVPGTMLLMTPFEGAGELAIVKRAPK